MDLEINGFLAECDVFPLSGPALRNEPASVSTLRTPQGLVKQLEFACPDLTETQDLTDYVRTEITEKGHIKYTSLLWGTLVVKPAEKTMREDLKQAYYLEFPDDLHYSINPTNLRVNEEEGTITFWRYAKERDAYGPKEDWLERFLLDHVCLGNGAHL